ncbi:MAG: hypothetical protein PHF00_10405 [Elusimicrobia bacterium]|nr:hypothetical protein [Elusimicrobiota bacterium]
MRMRLAYGLGVALIFAVVAWLRADLFWQAWSITLRQLGRGGEARWWGLGEMALFSGILAMTWCVLLVRADFARDALVAVLAAAAGWAAEAWGTRSGLWSYYTGEEPPLWIVPAWPLGALVVGRLGELASRRWPLGLRARRLGYWLLAAFAFSMTAFFLRPELDSAKAVAALAAVAAALAVRPDYGRDFWLLAAGLASVFFADVWGTTNGCWRYYVQAPGGPGLVFGVAFGMAFDAAVVLGCLKLSFRLRRPR